MSLKLIVPFEEELCFVEVYRFSVEKTDCKGLGSIA